MIPLRLVNLGFAKNIGRSDIDTPHFEVPGGLPVANLPDQVFGKSDRRETIELTIQCKES